MKKYSVYLAILSSIFLLSPCFAAEQLNPAHTISRPILVEPADMSLISTATPLFTWQKNSNAGVEYRIMIAEWKGKIILDKWVGNQNSYRVTSPNLFKDLEVYLWSVSAYAGEQIIQSETNSFCIDLNISLDLEVLTIKASRETDDWQAGDMITLIVEVLNCGPEPSKNTRVILYNGNTNINYRSSSALKKTGALDSTTIKYLEVGIVKKVELRGRLLPGLNHFFAQVKPDARYIDIYLTNNSNAGPVIQTIKQEYPLAGIFLIYDTYLDLQKDVRQLTAADYSTIDKNIRATQKYFWDHTQIVRIDVDTLHIKRLLTKKDFMFVDDNWGYVLNPKAIEQDLIKRGVKNNQYDFVFVFYPWQNSTVSWSGFRGYTYKAVNFILGQSIFSAQPIINNNVGNEEVIIHEVLHIIDHFYEKSGIEKFYSPNDQQQVTTFTNHLEYCDWILETWPSTDWFSLERVSKLGVKKTANQFSELIQGNLMLNQNYPNPFNNETVIVYELPGKEKLVHVNLSVFSILGERVCTLVDKMQKPGIYSITWNGKNEINEPVSTGIYFYKIQTTEQSIVKKALFIK